MTSIFLNCSKLCNTPFSVRNFLRLKMTSTVWILSELLFKSFN